MADLTLSDADRERVSAAIAAAESKTSGEIFVVVAHRADEYRAIPILWATLVALLVPLPLVFLTLMPVVQIYLIQLAVFAVLATILSLPQVKQLVVPSAVEAKEAHRLAVDQFLAHGLHMTEARTGVLIFVALAERYAEVVADAGIAAKVEQAAWQETVGVLLAEVREGRLAEGLIAAVGRAGALLAANFPPSPVDRDEVPNDVIVL